MLSIRRFLFRLRALVNRRSVDAMMESEMRHHVDCEIADREARGMAPAEARRTALRDFGGIERHKAMVRDERGLRSIEDFAADARYALRTLRRNPGYTVTAVTTFAVGIGLSTAIFGIVHGVLLRPLPYAESDRLAVIWERNVAKGVNANVVSVPAFEAWRASNRSFETMAALVPAPVTLGDVNPERVVGAEVSPGYFTMLGVRPALGRDFTADEGRPGAPRAIILSDELWRRRFSAAPDVVGETVSLDGRVYTVVGVMPPDFDPPRFGWLTEQQLWLPFAASSDNRAWGRFLLVVGRLRNGVSTEDAERDIVAISDRRERDDERLQGWSATVISLATQITGDVRRPLLVLLGAVVLLLAMAATNVANLTVGLLRRRSHEIAICRALGASPGRMFRRTLTHSLVLGAIGSAAGVGAAILGMQGLRAMMPPEMPRVASIGVDGPVLLVTICVALIVSVGFGAFASLRGPAAAARISDSPHGTAARVPARRGSGAVVIAEVALGVVLTVLAGLMIRSYVNLHAVNLGFDPEDVVTARVSLPGVSYGTAEKQRAFFESLGARLRAVRGVDAVSFATTRPFACCAPATSVSNPAAPFPPGEQAPTADVRYADSSFFPALRIPLEVGHGFASRERDDGPVRVVVNRALARMLWPEANPVGRRLHVQLYDGLDAEVVGVAADAHLADPRTAPRATVYLSSDRFPSTVRDIIIRSDALPEAIIALLRSHLASVDPTLPLYQLTTLEHAVDQSLAEERFITVILGLFAAVSLLLATVGVYGVFAGDVAAQRKEIGVRLALGSAGTAVVALVLRRALKLSVIGAAFGSAVGLMLSRSMSTLVYEIETSDPMSFLAVSGILVIAAILATLVPAVRAARISPLEVIRADVG
jgi:predicted permease